MPMNARGWIVTVVVLAAVAGRGLAEEKPRLPLPARGIPEMPPMRPAVITAGAQRLLLAETDVAIEYDGRKLVVNRPGWWVINYPLARIRGLEGRSDDAISRLLFGRPAAEVRNWYVKTLGPAAPEPGAPTGPAPIQPSRPATIVVDVQNARADDQGPGTAETPLATISAAVARAQPGDVIHVRPGVYRETVKIAKSGTAARPIRLEGVRGAHGAMPVVSGNDVFPPGAWTAVEGLPGVYRAALFTKRLGTVTLDGRKLIERSVPAELKPGECCLNRASREFLDLRLDGAVSPRERSAQFGKTWRRVTADEEGFVDLDARERTPGVVWASTHVWVDPRPKKPGVVWKPEFPEPITGRVEVGGEFRAARMSGAGLAAQVNKYRVWVNGRLLPSVVDSTEEDFQASMPHAHRNYGFQDVWDNFVLQEGWNHLVFQFDTTSRPQKTRFKFGLPKGIAQAVTSAEEPADRARPGAGQSREFVSEYLVLGPFAGEKDEGVYVRLPGDADPNTRTLDLAARGSELVSVAGDFVEVRGFELRDGAQFQQRAQAALEGEGILLEGCLLRDSEVKGVSFACQKDQRAAPIVIRNNWIVRPGNTGIGGAGASDRLTAENQNDPVPGRSPVVIEHNTIVGANWAGFPAFWESGGIKVFRLTGCVIRQNTIVGGCGPGIWLDWEHYGNRLEGNLFRNAWAFCVGIEASPGPNLVANNLSVNLRPGAVWFREAFLAWSTDRYWAVNNTVDGRWNPLPAWQNQVGAGGLFLGEGGADRQTRWVALDDRRQAFVNNLVVGCRSALRAKPNDLVAGNFTDEGKGATPAVPPPRFVDAEREDYRLDARSPLARQGVENELTKQVRYDFHGLLRFADAGRTVGAFRFEPEPVQGTSALVEVDLCDGTMQRLYGVRGLQPTGGN